MSLCFNAVKSSHNHHGYVGKKSGYSGFDNNNAAALVGMKQNWSGVNKEYKQSVT